MAAWVRVVMRGRQMMQQHLSSLFLLRVVNMLTLFLRRQVQRHVIEIRQAAAPHLSFCRSTATIHCLLSLYTTNRTFTQSQFAMIFGGNTIVRCINLFFSKIDSIKTPLLTGRELDGV